MTSRNELIISRTLSAGAVLLATALLTNTAWGQQIPMPEGPYEQGPRQHLKQKQKQKRPKMQRRQAMRQRLLCQKVGLSEPRAQKVNQIMSQFGPERRKLRQKAQKTEQRLRQLVRSDSNDEGAYKNALAELQALRKKQQALREAEMGALSGELTSKERARLMLASKQMKKMKKRGQRGQRGPKMGKGNKRWKRGARQGQRGPNMGKGNKRWKRGPAAKRGRGGKKGQRARRWRAQQG